MGRLVMKYKKSVLLLMLLIFFLISGRNVFLLQGSINPDGLSAAQLNASAVDFKNDSDTGINLSETNEINNNVRYIYMSMLSEIQKKVYNRVVESVEKYHTEVDVTESITDDDLQLIMTAIFNDHPELFWLDTKYKYNYKKSGEVVKINLFYNISESEIENCKQAFNNAADRIIQQTESYQDDLEKERYVYGCLQQLIYYNENADLNQSAYSALVNRSTVCAGYSRAFQYIMQKVGITCFFCTGSVESGMHAWNIIKLNNKYYNVDLSWDDMLAENDTVPSYQYFNLTDREFNIEHHRSEISEKLPKCE